VRPGPEGLLAALDRHGEIPLPPYIHETLADPERCQTVFADRPESVAAPTAGLHLTPAVLDGCRAAGARIETVVLAVGLGTFKPITAERVADHPMHAERYRVPRATLDACAAADRVVAVGTTVVRALESAAATGEPEGSTDLFIRPGHEFRVVDALLTNFHLPRSSLLVLIEAFYGPAWRDLYALARQEGYRFLSFGDAMLLARNLHADVAIAT
jgi:S-adenosylmethionine:tRNA ribosyltransferase-isomerase